MAELRKRGIITAVICSTPFMRLGHAQAKTFGAHDLPLMEIAHPLGGLHLDEVKERAQVVVPQLVRLIKEQFK